MNTALKITFVLSLLALLTAAVSTRPLAWDHPGMDQVGNPVDGYFVYSDDVQIADVPDKTANVTVTKAGTKLEVSAYRNNPNGGIIESERSEPLYVMQAPSKITITYEAIVQGE